MQELLAKIIKMDENARKVKRQAEEEKIASEKEIEELRQQIYDDYIERAKERVEKNIAVDRREADEELARYREKTAELKDEMHRRYEENADHWVDEIVSNVLA